jgi:hypothetical protein
MRMLDGVLERRNEFFDVGWQLAATLDDWPERDGRSSDVRGTQGHRVEIVVQISSSPAMPRVA